MQNNHAAHEKIFQSWQLLKVTYGLLFLAAGADKFMNIVTDWMQYVWPGLLNILPVNLQQLMGTVGIIEVAIGLTILFFSTRMGAYLAMGWLLLIVVNLFMAGGYYDVALRDIVMAVGAWVLAQLSEIYSHFAKTK